MYLSKRKGELCPFKDLHLNVYSSLFLIAKQRKQLKCPTGENGIPIQSDTVQQRQAMN